MRTISLLFLLFAPFAQNINSSGSRSLVWRDVREQYRQFDQIEATLVNQGTQPIYLHPAWVGKAQLKRFNEETRRWELGSWPSSRGIVPGATATIEVKPGGSQRVVLDWKASFDDTTASKMFVTNVEGGKRELPGKYKLLIRYAPESWAPGRLPQLTYVAESPEFNIVR